MVHVVLFKNANFHGDHKHVVAAEPNLNASDDNGFNDAVSSLVVLDGNWRFYMDAGFKNPYPSRFFMASLSSAGVPVPAMLPPRHREYRNTPAASPARARRRPTATPPMLWPPWRPSPSP